MSEGKNSKNMILSANCRKVLERIEGKKIVPLSKRYFIFLYSLLWIFIFLSMAIGSASVSIVMVVFKNAFAAGRSASGIKDFLALIPYFWLLTAAVLLGAGYVIFKKTKKGYKYSFFIFTIITGTVVFAAALVLMWLGFTEELFF